MTCLPLKPRLAFLTALPALTALVALALAAAPGSTQAADMPVFSSPTPAASAKEDAMAAGRDALRAKDWRKAITRFTQAVKDQPTNADAHNLLAYAYRKQATPDLPKAFEHYEAALKLNPKHKGAHEYIGEAYLMDKKPAKAEEHLAQLKLICGGPGCEEYDDLAKAVSDYKSKNR